MAHSAVAFDEWLISRDRLAQVINELRPPTTFRGPERRKSERYSVVLTVDATPFDDDFRAPSVPNLKMFTCDISNTGIGLIFVHSVDTKYLALTMHSHSGTEIKVMTEVVRCEPTEVDPNLFHIGAKFVTRP